MQKLTATLKTKQAREEQLQSAIAAFNAGTKASECAEMLGVKTSTFRSFIYKLRQKGVSVRYGKGVRITPTQCPANEMEPGQVVVYESIRSYCEKSAERYKRLVLSAEYRSAPKAKRGEFIIPSESCQQCQQ